MSAPTPTGPLAAPVKQLSPADQDFVTALAAVLDADAAHGSNAPQKVHGLPFGGAVGQVVLRLLGSGLGAGSIIQWLPLIVQLVTQLGSIVAVVQQIIDWINQGKTPTTTV